MIENALELSQHLCRQALNSGLAKTAIVILVDNNNNLHKSEYGLTENIINNKEEDSVIEMQEVDEENL